MSKLLLMSVRCPREGLLGQDNAEERQLASAEQLGLCPLMDID